MLRTALRELDQSPGTRAPEAIQLDIAGLRSWRLEPYSLTAWYFERSGQVVVVRLLSDSEQPGSGTDRQSLFFEDQA